MWERERREGIWVAAAVVLGAAFANTSFGQTYDGSLYNEQYRPQFHFTADEGWLNDPHGLIYHEGEYHLFFQHTPSANRNLDDTRWGHAVTTDLVRWEQIEDAILPKTVSGTKYPAFSGSAFIDHNNTLGKQVGDDPTMAIAYTSWGQGQFLSYSNDNGRTWSDYENNPVLTLPNDSAKSFQASSRDPKVFWYEPDQKWVMALYQRVNNQPGYGIHTSTNLNDWTFQSHVPEFYVTPDMFELPVDGDPSNTRWVMSDWENYGVGDFNGEQFTFDSPTRDVTPLDYGTHFSANQTWANMPSEDGRRIQIAWMRRDGFPGMSFNQQMTFPRELTLRNVDGEILLYQQPIREIASLVDTVTSIQGQVLNTGANILSNVSSELLDIELTLKGQQANQVTMSLRDQNIIYNPTLGTLSVKGNQVQVHDPGNSTDGVTIRALLDRTSLEVFVNDGRWTFVEAFLPSDNPITHSLTSTGGSAFIESLEIRTLESSWVEPLAAGDLQMLFDPLTGETTLKNTGSTNLELKGYSITSPTGRLNPGAWQSLQDNPSFSGWIEDNATDRVLSEANSGGSTLLAPGQEISLGRSVMPFAVPEFGVAARDSYMKLEFETADQQTLAGRVELAGPLAVNNLLLTVDPVTGEATLTNRSNTTVSLRAYSILSRNSLRAGDSNWTSLADQGKPGVLEANGSSSHLSELIPEAANALVLAPGEHYLLGTLFDPARARDLTLEFAIAPIVGDGDYNGDGIVNLADFSVWRDNLGANISLPGEADTPGVVTVEDYAVWRAHFGSVGGGGPLLTYDGVVQYRALSDAGGSSALQAVPEPRSAISLVIAAGGMIRVGRAACCRQR